MALRLELRSNGSQVFFSLPTFSADPVDKVLSTSCHGISWRNDISRSELYPALSLFKRSSEPNCEFPPGGHYLKSIIMTGKDVSAGEELFMMYQEVDVVARKWGIKS